MRTQFTAEIRVLMCEQCGAPLEAPLEGGSVSCAYCRAQNVVATRDERPTLGMPAAEAAIDEQERLQRLRAQDGRPMVPPASIMHLLAGGSLDPARVQEAFLVYQATRKEVRTTGSPEAAERLYFLTLIASKYFTEQGDDARRRAILETTLDVVFLPRHKQVLRCMLATSAAKEGDLVAAERWLAPCDPRSVDLESDSAYRVARAYLDTVRGDARAVLRVLGAADDEIPIVDALDPAAAVLRANALEKMGNLDGAVAALRTRMSNENASGRRAIEQYVRMHSHLRLCEHSLAIAAQSYAQQAAKLAAARSGGGIGLWLLGIGILLLLVASALVAVPLVSGLWFMAVNGVPSHGSLLGGGLASALGPMVTALGPGIAGLVMTSVGYLTWRRAKEAAYVRQHGIAARGTIRNVTTTGTRINDTPLVRVQLTVQREGVAPYVTSCVLLAPIGLQGQLVPGAVVPLRVHPRRPEQVIIELA